FARIVGEHFRNQSESRKNDDVNFRMTEEPEQVLIQDCISSRMIECMIIDINFIEIKTCSKVAIKEQQNGCTEQHGKRNQTQNGSDEQRPNCERHTIHAHSFGAEIQNR